MNPVEDARACVRERHPDSIASFLGGSAAQGRHSSTSDLDIVILLAGTPAPYRETILFNGWLVELFVHTRVSYEEFAAAETRARRSPLLHMCGEGVTLTDTDGAAGQVQSDARRRLAVGPTPLSAQEGLDRRYQITTLMDDLADSRDEDELLFIGHRLLTEVAELVLIAGGSWSGAGKWLLRRFRNAAPEQCASVLAGYRHLVAHSDPERLLRAVTDTLDLWGGRLSVGYFKGSRSAKGG